MREPIKPPLQRRLENSINNMRSELGRLKVFRRTEHPSKGLEIYIRKFFKKTGTNPIHPDHQQYRDVY